MSKLNASLAKINVCFDALSLPHANEADLDDLNDFCLTIQPVIALYSNSHVPPTKRQLAGHVLVNLLDAYNNQVQSKQSLLSEEALGTPQTRWQQFKALPWKRILNQIAFSILVCFGVINATAEAFDGVSSVLFALGFSNPTILASCIVLGLFSISLYFAFELTQLSGAMGLKFIENYSEANRLLELQTLVKSIAKSQSQLLTQALNAQDMERFAHHAQSLQTFYKNFAPVQTMVLHLKTEKPSKARTFFKFSVAALAGFLSGALAFFNGEALLKVISVLTGVTIGAAWLPTVLGGMCFAVVTSVALANEGRSMMRLIDKLLGRPSKIIDKKLRLSDWELSPNKTMLHATVLRLHAPSASESGISVFTQASSVRKIEHADTNHALHL